MTAGCIAGAVEATCVWPMEYIKVRYFVIHQCNTIHPSVVVHLSLSFVVFEKKNRRNSNFNQKPLEQSPNIRVWSQVLRIL